MKRKLFILLASIMLMSSSGVAVAVWSFLPTNCFPHIGKYEEIVMWQEFCDEAHGMFPWRQKIILNAAINNFQTRIDLLNYVLRQVENIKNLKQNNDENLSI